MKEDVKAAITEITDAGVGTGIRYKEDTDGGAYVIVDGVDIGGSFTPGESWIGFHILWNCPEADVYPHFIAPELKYTGERPTPREHLEGNLPEGLSRDGEMPGYKQKAVQVSRSSPHRDKDTDTPLDKLLRVTEFLRGL